MTSRLLTALLMAALGISLMCAVYKVTDHDCRERGGHTEIVYGGRGGWVCEGAEK